MSDGVQTITGGSTRSSTMRSRRTRNQGRVTRPNAAVTNRRIRADVSFIIGRVRGCTARVVSVGNVSGEESSVGVAVAEIGAPLYFHQRFGYRS